MEGRLIRSKKILSALIVTGLLTGSCLGTVYANSPVTDIVGVNSEGYLTLKSTNGDTYSSTITAAAIVSAGLSSGDLSALEYTAGNGITITDRVISAKAGNHVTVDSNGINVTDTGSVASGDTELVTGGTVYTALQAQKTATETALAGKANVDASNVSDHASGWASAIGTGSVASDSNLLVTGKVVYNEVRPATDGTYVKTAQTTATNFTALDTQVKTNADNIDTKANANMDNLTRTGKQNLYNMTVFEDSATVTVEDYIEDSSTDIGPRTVQFNVNTTSAVEGYNDGIITSHGVYSEVRPEDGTYVKTAQTTAANLTALDTAVKNNADAIDAIENLADGQVTYDANSKKFSNAGTEVTDITATGTVTAGTVTATSATIGDVSVADGKISNLTAGILSADSKEAVNGSQLYATNQNVATNTADITNLKNLSNISEDGETVIKTLAKGSVNVVGTGAASVTKSDVDGVDTYTVAVNGNGSVTSENTGLVTGGTVYDALQTQKQAIDTSLEGKANIALDNINDEGKTAVKTLAQQAITVAGDGAATVEKTSANGVDTYTVSVAGNGAVADGDTGLVTGDVVYDAMMAESRPAADGKYITIANTAGANLTALDTAIKTLSAGQVTYNTTSKKFANADTEITDITVTGTITAGTISATTGSVGGVTISGNKISGLNEGTLSADSTDAVNGSQLYTTNQNVATNTTDIANLKNLSNISTEGETVIKNLAKGSVNVVGEGAVSVEKTDTNGVDTYTVNVEGTGTVAVNDTGLISGKTLYNEVRPAADGTYITIANTAGANLTALDTAIKTLSAGQVTYDTTSKKFANAGTEITDITVTGTMTAGTISATTGSVGGVTISGNKISDLNAGTLSADSKEAVNGSQLYTTNQNVATNTTNIATNTTDITALKNLSNITDTGKNVVKNLAQEAVTVAAGDRVTVTSAEVNGVKTYTVSANNDGVIADGNTGLVSGGTVYTALQDIQEATSTSLEGKADTDLGNITDDGKAVITGLTDVVSGDAYTKVEAATDANGKKTYTVSAVVDGQIAEGNTGLVTGGDVWSAVDTAKTELEDKIDDVVTDTQTELGGKADTDLGNITDDGKTVVKDLAKEAVSVTGSGYATVTSTKNNGNIVYNVDVQANGAIEADNKGLVDGGTIYTAIKDAEDRTDEKLATKANTGLDNLSDAGVSVIKAKAQEAVTVKDGDHTTVSSEMDGETRIYRVNVQTDGKVENGNEGIVNGGTVKEYFDTAVGTPTDGNYVKAGNNVAGNLNALDNAIGTTQPGYFVTPERSVGANLNALDLQTAQNTVDIAGLRQGQQRLSGHINETGAKAAALAGLHPLEIDGDQKWNLAAGVGNYKGETAGAIGVFYRPAENIMFNLASTIDSHEGMVTGGISIALDKGNIGMTKRQMANKIRSQQETIDTMAHEMAEMKAMLKELMDQKAAEKGEKAAPAAETAK